MSRGAKTVQKSEVEELQLRTAQATDSEFVFAVKRAAFREYVEQIWGWEDTEQRDLHHRRFASQDLRIIQCHGTDVGFLSTRPTPLDTLKVDQLYILPEYQGKGIGAACMKHIIDDANRRTEACDASGAKDKYPRDRFLPEAGIHNCR